MTEISDWLSGLFIPPSLVELDRFVAALAVSIAAGATVTALHRRYYRDPTAGSGMERSFVLVGPAVTTLFVAIQFSVPLSLGLFGVFSIVRFRNPVRDPEEIGFLLLLLASAVLCAVSQYALLVIFLFSAGAVLALRGFVFGDARPRSGAGVALITIAVKDLAGVEERISAILEAHLPRATIQSFSYSDCLLTASCRFSGPRPPNAGLLEHALKEFGEVRQVDVFFSDTGLALPTS